MAYALSLASWVIIGGAGCFALASFARDVRAMPSRFLSLRATLRADKD